MSADDLVSPNAERNGAAPQVVLRRALGLPLLVSYGLGVTVGAGIYVLVGQAASRAGVHAPTAFLIAAAVMAISAMTFAEMSARFPVSAGEAAYVKEGLRSNRLALLVGLMVATAGIVSAAAISRGAANYLSLFVTVPHELVVAAVVLLVGAVAAWGIKEAVGLAALMMAIEVGGLLVIIGAGMWQDPASLAALPQAFTGLGEYAAWSGVMGATLIAFFAFIGFEDMVNVAEEVENPERTMPLAIAITLLVSTVLYVLVVWVVLRAIPGPELAESTAPLSLAFERLTGASPLILAAIAVFATINGVIVQMVMASRVLYGLSRQGVLPEIVGRVSPLTRTPLVATGIVVALILVLAVGIPIGWLADMASRVILTVFTFVNISLVALKLRPESGPPPAFRVPIAVPVAGALTSAGLLIADLALR